VDYVSLSASRIVVTYLDGGIFYGNGAGNFSSTATIHNTVVPDQVADNAKGIM
jgi:hypothetical protein